MVGASCVTASTVTDDTRAQSCTVFAVVVGCTHLSFYTLIAYAAVAAEGGASITCFFTEIANLNVFFSTAVAKSYKGLVTAVAASLAFVAVLTEIVTARTRLVTPAADPYAVLTGRALLTEYVVVVSALCTAVFFLIIAAVTAVLAFVAVPAKIFGLVTRSAFIFSTITVLVATHTNFAEIKACVLTTADSTLFILLAGVTAGSASVTVLTYVFLTAPAAFTSAVLAYGSASTAGTTGVAYINATFSAHSAFFAKLYAIFAVRVAKTARGHTTNAETAVVAKVIRCTAKRTASIESILRCASDSLSCF